MSQGVPPPNPNGIKQPPVTRNFTPQVPPGVLQDLLVGYDEHMAEYLVDGFNRGFSIGCINIPRGDSENNLPSCRDAPRAIDKYLSAELAAGRIAGPFPEHCSWIHKISPIGVIPKKSPGTYRIIHHLSFPYGNSVNDFIPRENTAVSYGSLDDAIRIINGISTPFLAKTDIASAYRMVPIRLADCPLLGFRWRGRSYVDLALPMGCSSSAQIFLQISDALVWIAQQRFGAGPMVSVLDDFLFIGDSHAACQTALTGFQEMCQPLHVPLREDNSGAMPVAVISRNRARCRGQRDPFA